MRTTVAISLWSILLISAQVLLSGCESKERREVMAKVDEAERNIYVTAACLEDFYSVTDQHIPLGEFLLSESPTIQKVWGLTEEQLDETTNPTFLARHFMRRFDQLGPAGLNSTFLPDPAVQVASRKDPFSPGGDLLRYTGHESSHWYILSSVGPNGVMDLPFNRIDPRPHAQYMSNRTFDGLPLHVYQYDPTNGTNSGGDLLFWRDAKHDGTLVIQMLRKSRKSFNMPTVRLGALR